MNETNTSYIEMAEDEFESQYPLLQNRLNPNTSWMGCLFETYGEEMDFVRQQHPATIWTLIESDDGDLIVSGCWWVNRIGYFVSTVPVPEGTTIEVLIRRESDDEEIEDYLEPDNEGLE